jgi:hypothetical protein
MHAQMLPGAFPTTAGRGLSTNFPTESLGVRLTVGDNSLPGPNDVDNNNHAAASTASQREQQKSVLYLSGNQTRML